MPFGFKQDVMGLGEHECPYQEFIEVLGMVVDHNIGVYQALVAAKDHLLPADKREMLIEPELLVREALRKFRGH